MPPAMKMISAATTTTTPMMMATCWPLFCWGGAGGGAISPSSIPQDLQAASVRPTLALHSGHLGMEESSVTGSPPAKISTRPAPRAGALFREFQEQGTRRLDGHRGLVGVLAQLAELHDVLLREVGTREALLDVLVEVLELRGLGAERVPEIGELLARLLDLLGIVLLQDVVLEGADLLELVLRLADLLGGQEHRDVEAAVVGRLLVLEQVGRVEDPHLHLEPLRD